MYTLHTRTRTHMRAQKYTQSEATKQSRAIIQKMSEMERIVTMCPLNERGRPKHTHTRARTHINVSALYVSLQSTVLCADTIYVVYVFA